MRPAINKYQNMKLLTSPVDTAYMHFFVCYCKTLKHTSVLNKHWIKNNVAESIDYVLGGYITNFLETNSIPDQFKTAEYYKLEGSGNMIPPGCEWISKSGRFSCHDLFDILGCQSYILWDINRKVALPLLFHDLLGIDEENGILFCRTLCDFHFGNMDSPMRINLDWINMPHLCKSFPEDYDRGNYYDLTSKQQQDIITREAIRVGRTGNDLSCFYYFPDFKELLLNSVELLVKGIITEEEEQDLIHSILSHPDTTLYLEGSYLSQTIYEFTQDNEVHKIIWGKLYPDRDELPF